MKIVLCDDDKNCLDQMNDIVRELSPKAEIYRYESAEKLINSGNVFDIAFLDIEMDGGSGGFNAAKYVKEKNVDCVISFFTNYDSYARDGYKYRAYRFILKDEGRKMIKHHFAETIKEYNRINGKISVINGSAKVLVPIQDIMYIQMKDHYGDVFVVSGKKYLWRISLAKIESYLAQFHFERCHNSCIVNMNYVAEKVKNKFILTDGHTITIGRTYIKSINQRYKSLGKGERE